MQRVRVSVVRHGRMSPGCGFQVYGDQGGGTIDWSRPMTSRRQLIWLGSAEFAGHLAAGHTMDGHLGAAEPDGHLAGVHGCDEHLAPGAAVGWESDLLVFGRFRFAVAFEDGMGRPGGLEPVEVSQVVNSPPPPPDDLRPIAQDEQTGAMRFSFTPSERLTGGW